MYAARTYFYICGASQSGKSFFLPSMLRNLEYLFSSIPTKIIHAYGVYQKEFAEISETVPNIQFVEGFPNDLYDMTDAHDSSIIMVILDDLMSQCSNDQRVVDLFTRGSHHREITVLFRILTQNLFWPGKLSRTLSLDAHYMLMFRNPRDSLGITTLARQMYPKNVDYLLESYNDATKRPDGYLLLDLHQLTPADMRLRTNILPNERTFCLTRDILFTLCETHISDFLCYVII